MIRHNWMLIKIGISCLINIVFVHLKRCFTNEWRVNFSCTFVEIRIFKHNSIQSLCINFLFVCIKEKCVI